MRNIFTPRFQWKIDIVIGYHNFFCKSTSLWRHYDPNHRVHHCMRLTSFLRSIYYLWNSMQWHCRMMCYDMIFGILSKLDIVLNYLVALLLRPSSLSALAHMLTTRTLDVWRTKWKVLFFIVVRRSKILFTFKESLNRVTSYYLGVEHIHAAFVHQKFRRIR